MLLLQTNQASFKGFERYKVRLGSENSRIPLTMFREAESTLYNPLHGDCDLDLHQPTELSSVKQLLHRYKKLREKNPVSVEPHTDGYVL